MFISREKRQAGPGLDCIGLWVELLVEPPERANRQGDRAAVCGGGRGCHSLSCWRGRAQCQCISPEPARGSPLDPPLSQGIAPPGRPTERQGKRARGCERRRRKKEKKTRKHQHVCSEAMRAACVTVKGAAKHARSSTGNGRRRWSPGDVRMCESSGLTAAARRTDC